MVTRVPLTRGQVAIVDDEDADAVLSWKWHAFTSDGKRWYARARQNGKHVYLHRFLMDAPSGMVVDHIDGDGLNNQRSNMRVCTQGENMRNKKILSSQNTTGYIGVHWDKAKKMWFSHISVNGKTIYLGKWETPEDAALARDLAALRYHGEFATFNFLNRNMS